MCFVVNDLQKIPGQRISAPVCKSTEAYLLLEKEKKIPRHCSVYAYRGQTFARASVCLVICCRIQWSDLQDKSELLRERGNGRCHPLESALVWLYRGQSSPALCH